MVVTLGRVAGQDTNRDLRRGGGAVCGVGGVRAGHDVRDRRGARVALVAFIALLVAVVAGLVALALPVLVIGRRSCHLHRRGGGVADAERERVRGRMPARVQAGYRQPIVVEVERDDDGGGRRGCERHRVAVDYALGRRAGQHGQAVLRQCEEQAGVVVVDDLHHHVRDRNVVVVRVVALAAHADRGQLSAVIAVADDRQALVSSRAHQHPLRTNLARHELDHSVQPPRLAEVHRDLDVAGTGEVRGELRDGRRHVDEHVGGGSRDQPDRVADHVAGRLGDDHRVVLRDDDLADRRRCHVQVDAIHRLAIAELVARVAFVDAIVLIAL